jgi:hypothetical protein
MGNQTKKAEFDGACVKQGGNKMQEGFGGDTLRKSIIWKTYT